MFKRETVARWTMALALVGLAGCANYPAIEEMTPKAIPNIQPKQKSVAVAAGFSVPMQPVNLLRQFHITPQHVTKSIQDAITTNGAFQQIFYGPGADYVIGMEVVNIIEPPGALNFDMTVKTEAVWTVYEGGTRRVLMQQNVMSSYTATMAQNFDGSARFALATLGSLRENIVLGLTAISRAKLD